MSEALLQNYTPTVATFIFVGIGLLYNNSRLTDVSTSVNKRIDDLNTNLNKRIDALRSDFNRLESVVVGSRGEALTHRNAT